MQNKFKILKFCGLCIFALFLFADIFLILETPGLLWIAGILLWGSVVWAFKFSARVSVLLGVCLLCYVPFFLIFKKLEFAEGFAQWGYVFLIVGAVQLLLESLSAKKRPFS